VQIKRSADDRQNWQDRKPAPWPESNFGYLVVVS